MKGASDSLADRRSLPPSRRALKGGRSFVVSVTAVSVAVLLLCPVVSATYAIRVTPPYAGLVPIVTTTINTNGCHSRGHFGVSPVVNITSGRVRLAESATSSYCSGSFDYAVTSATAGFEGPNFTVPASGVYAVAFDWRLTYNASLQAQGPGTSAVASVLAVAVGVLYDATTHTILSPGSTDFVLLQEIDSGTWSHGADRLSVDLEVDLSLTTGHLYYFETFLECDATAEETGPGSAGAMLNLGTSGDHARLVSLDLTG